MLFNQAVDGFTMRGQGAERRLLILPHEAAVPVYVGAAQKIAVSLRSIPTSTGSSRST